MGKSKNTSTSKVEPWIPDQATFDKFRGYGQSLITDQFRQGLNQAEGSLNNARRNIGADGTFNRTMIDMAYNPDAKEWQFDKATTDAQTPQYADGFKGTLAEMMDPNARSAAFDTVKRNVADSVMQDVNATFAGSGMTGSSLHQQNLAKGLASGIADVENQAFQTGRDRAMQAAQIGQSDLQQQKQRGLMAAMARQDAFASGQDRAFNAANALNQSKGAEFARNLALSQAQAGLGNQYQGVSMGAVQGLMGNAVGAASQTSTQQTRPGLGSIIGTGLQIASLFSDERLKTDKKRVGKLDDGTPVYTYKYKEGVAPEGLEGKTLMGVMADQVKKKKAVEDDPSGFKRVNYGAL